MIEQTRASGPTTLFAATDAFATGWGVDDTQVPGLAGTFDSTLNSSLLADLRRFDDAACDSDVLAIIAAGVRHAKPLVLHLQHGLAAVVLSVFPREQLFHCANDLCALAPAELAQLRLVHVEPGPVPPQRTEAGHTGPLGQLLWCLAMHGATSELLPEIAGPVKYRLLPSLSLVGLTMDAATLALLEKMRDRPMVLDQLLRLTPLDRAPVRRLLNALYLQSGLITTRAFQSSWFTQ